MTHYNVSRSLKIMVLTALTALRSAED